MKVTASLMQEHQQILKFLDLMQDYVNHALQKPECSLLLLHAQSFIRFIHEFADALHHAKEENVLFRVLEVPGVLNHCNPVPQMVWEHHKARELVQNMLNALKAENLEQLAASMSQYIRLLKEHIYKEDSILYPMAERALSEAAKISLLKEYELTDSRLEAQAIWQKYTALFVELEDLLKVQV